jgi:hypothetical protein
MPFPEASEYIILEPRKQGENLMNKLIFKLPLMVAIVAAVAFSATDSWAAKKKSAKVAAAKPAAAAPAPAQSAPGSEFMKPAPKVAPIFPAAGK